MEDAVYASKFPLMTKILLYCFGDLGILSLYVIANDCIFIDVNAETSEENLGAHVLMAQV